VHQEGRHVCRGQQCRHREKQAGQSRPGSAQRRSAWGPAAWRQQRREEEGGRLGGALLLGRADRRRGGVRTAGLGPAAGGRILAGSARVGELGGEGDAYIGMVESFWLARQEKKWAGLLVWAEKIFFYFLFLQKDSTNLI